jgi:acyl-CoA thioester hydrolase
MLAHEARVRVRYAETDQMGVVYHANYLIWMEIGRVELCRASGVNYRDMEAAGVLLVVAEVNCRYHQSARYDDEIVVHTRIGQANPRVIQFDYEIRLESGILLASGYTKHVFCNPEMRHIKLPAVFRPIFGITAGNSQA